MVIRRTYSHTRILHFNIPLDSIQYTSKWLPLPCSSILVKKSWILNILPFISAISASRIIDTITNKTIITLAGLQLLGMIRYGFKFAFILDSLSVNLMKENPIWPWFGRSSIAIAPSSLVIIWPISDISSAYGPISLIKLSNLYYITIFRQIIIYKLWNVRFFTYYWLILCLN